MLSSVGAVAGLVSVTALEGSKTIEQSFSVLNESVGLINDTIKASRQVANATMSGWVEEALISAKIDSAYAQVELAEAELEIASVLAKAEALRNKKK
jgi:hypothetical protein